MGSRTRARECALQALYQLDLGGGEPREAVRAVLAHFEEADESTERFADELVRGVQSERAQIDALIQQSSTHWKLDRMARVDRNILRLATYELLYREDIPPLVTINEAIDIAKKFSTKNSGPFVNGILDNIRLRSAPPGKQKK